MQRFAHVSAQKWVWRAMVRSALVPLILVETILIAVYLISNNLIREANINYIHQQADKELQVSAQRESEIIREQLRAISRQTDIYRSETQRIITSHNHPVPAIEAENYALSSKGVFYSTHDIGGAASFYSAITPVEKQDHEKIWRLAQLDPLMKQIKENTPLISAIYFNSWDSYNRIYPWINTAEQYDEKMDIPKYNFYYLADKNNNPMHSVVWTDVYIDPAGKGWMASCIAPVYRQDFLEGVVGLDITVSSIIDKIQSLSVPWGGYAILVNSNGNIMALPPDGENDFGLHELTSHNYQEAIKKEIFKPEQFNLFQEKYAQSIFFEMKNNQQGKGVVELNGSRKLIAWESISETGWKLITIIDENKVYGETRTLAHQFAQIGYLMIAGLVLFYVVFIFFIWVNSRRISESISNPLLEMKSMADKISREIYQLNKPDFAIVELQNTALAIISMAQKLEGITFDLRQAKEDADAANKTKTLFLSSMSHELRTPLNAILGFGQLLLKDQNLSERDRHDYTNEIMTAGDHLLKLIDDVLKLSHIESQEASFQMESVNAIAICYECQEMLRAIIEKEQLTLSISIHDHEVMVLADKTRLRQIMINLISNAIKYNHPNGDIKITSRVNNDRLRINVEDSGSGISENNQQELFKPFNRLGYETSGIQGTGIGLSISKKLVESMNGEIGFSSKWQEGSTFWIELPLSYEQQKFNTDEIPAYSKSTTMIENAEENANIGTVMHHLLYIGSDQTDIRQLTKMAKECRCEVTFFTNKTEVLNLIEHAHVDIILLEVTYSDGDAFEFLSQLRQSPITMYIPVIALADDIIQMEAQATPDLYFDYVLIKPLECEHFWAVIQRMLNYAQ
jgi:signal transduction histidine kinase/CheY-like chemotaxis protein